MNCLISPKCSPKVRYVFSFVLFQTKDLAGVAQRDPGGLGKQITTTHEVASEGLVSVSEMRYLWIVVFHVARKNLKWRFFPALADPFWGLLHVHMAHLS